MSLTYVGERLKVDLSVCRNQINFRKVPVSDIKIKCNTERIWTVSKLYLPTPVYCGGIYQNISAGDHEASSPQEKHQYRLFFTVSHWLESPLAKVRLNLPQLLSESLWSIIVQGRQKKCCLTHSVGNHSIICIQNMYSRAQDFTA